MKIKNNYDENKNTYSNVLHCEIFTKMGDRIGLADGKQVVIMQTDCKNKRLKRMNQNQEHPRLWCGWRRGLIMYQTYASMQSYEWNVT